MPFHIQPTHKIIVPSLISHRNACCCVFQVSSNPVDLEKEKWRKAKNDDNNPFQKVEKPQEANLLVSEIHKGNEERPPVTMLEPAGQDAKPQETSENGTSPGVMFQGLKRQSYQAM